MTAAVRLIVLSSTKLGESQRVLHTLSEEFGRRSFIVSVRSHGSSALFLPLSIIDAEIRENPKSDLWRAGGISAAYPLNGLRSDMIKNAVSLFMSEVLFRTLHDGVYEDGLFHWVEHSILTLDSLGAEYVPNYHIRFLLEFCSALGFQPSSSDIAPYSGEQHANLSRMLEVPFADSLLLKFSGSDRTAMAEAIIGYLSAHTESSINIRSLSVLHDICRDFSKFAPEK